MAIDFNFLFAAPVLMLGFVFAALAAILLALTFDRRRLVAGMIGFAAGYLALGTLLADVFGADAVRRGVCGDAAWGGPGAGGLLGVVAGVIVFELVRWRSAAASSREPQ